MDKSLALPLLLILAACAGMSEERRQELAEWKAEFYDARKACAAQGGHIVQIAPEVGGRYWCME